MKTILNAQSQASMLAMLVSAAFLNLASPESRALQTGSDVKFQYYWPNFGDVYPSLSQDPLTVVAGAEISSPWWNIDLSDGTVTLTITSSGGGGFEPHGSLGTTFNGFYIEDKYNQLSDITDFYIDSVNGLYNLAAGDLNFNANAVWVDLAGVGWGQAGNSAVFKVTFAPQTSSVPDSGPAGLLLAGTLAALVFLRKPHRSDRTNALTKPELLG